MFLGKLFLLGLLSFNRYGLFCGIFYLFCCYRPIKTEVDPWQLLETDLVEGDDPLLLER